jgi:3,4-dihydroxy 2-butanone 4-phosphate synthase / GTP cyclohydrolase II
MRQTLLSRFGNPGERVEKALSALRQGRGVIVTDDENRENEGDLIFAAESVTEPQMLSLIRDCSGIVCLCLTPDKAEALGLSLMVRLNTSRFGTAFTVSIDAAEGITTGVSAADRVATVKAAVADNATPDNLSRPGHMFPLIAVPGGVLKRKGHTEATVDLPRLAGLKPCGLLCEVMKADGTMARLPELISYAEKHALVVITIDDLVNYRWTHEKAVHKVAEARLPTKYGEFRALAYTSDNDPAEHLALVMGEVAAGGPVMVRIDSECATGEIFGSRRCDCGEQLDFAMQRIARQGRGVVVFLRQEGRGIGLHNKIKAYALQDQGLDTVEANLALGFAPDLRDYRTGAQILKDLGLGEVELLTNNPDKVASLESQGLKVVKRIPLVVPPNLHNRSYLETKKHKMGHL